MRGFSLIYETTKSRRIYTLNNIYVTPHAMLKASELFGINYGPEARQFVIDNLKKATFVSEIVGEDGKVDRLFGYRRIAFILDRNDPVVITVYPRKNVEAGLREKVTELLFEHLDDLKRQEQELEDELLVIDMEVAMLEELSKVGVKEATVWVPLMRREYRHKSEELREFGLGRSKVAKGVVAYL
jgi:hypothetical protein